MEEKQKAAPLVNTERDVLYFFLQNVDKVWINIQKDSSGVWRTQSGDPLTGFNSDWDSGQPITAAGANCAAMIQLAG